MSQLHELKTIFQPVSVGGSGLVSCPAYSDENTKNSAIIYRTWKHGNRLLFMNKLEVSQPLEAYPIFSHNPGCILEGRMLHIST